MAEYTQIFDQMRVSPMNDWVGGSDPELVGDASMGIFTRLVAVDGNSRVLDFGCGIGRGLTSLYKLVSPSQLVGMDIMPSVIDFCDTQIAPHIPTTKFELIQGSNDHYDRFIEQRRGKSQAALTEEYRDHFNAAFAFSVFTHVSLEDFQSLLTFVSAMLQPGGRFLFTCFELNEFSRFMVTSGQAMFPLDAEKLKHSGDVFIANDDDPLAFIAFDQALIRKMVWQAGMAVTKVEYGCWMGGLIGGGLQDAIVCTKLPELVAGGDVSYTALVSRDAKPAPVDDIAAAPPVATEGRFQKMTQFWRGRR